MTLRRSSAVILGLISIQKGPPYSSSLCCQRRNPGDTRRRSLVRSTVFVGPDKNFMTARRDAGCSMRRGAASLLTSSLVTRRRIVGCPAYLSPAGRYPAGATKVVSGAPTLAALCNITEAASGPHTVRRVCLERLLPVSLGLLRCRVVHRLPFCESQASHSMRSGMRLVQRVPPCGALSVESPLADGTEESVTSATPPARKKRR